MTTRAAIDGEYADFKIIRSRSVAQFVVEIPLEQAAEAVRLFGVPLPGQSKRMALALLAEPTQIEAQAEPAPAANGNGKRSWREMTGPQQAGIRCNDPEFWKFLREEGESGVNDKDAAANYVRLACGVHSRAEIATKRGAAVLWHDLDIRFENWQKCIGP